MPPSTASRPASVRRAFDAGWSAAEVHEFLDVGLPDPGPPAADLPGRRRRAHLRHRAGRARRGVPARRRRGGADRAAPPPEGRVASGLRRLAPTVLVSTHARSTCCCRGCASSAPHRSSRRADGTVRVARPDLLRARTPRDRRTAGAERRPGGRPPGRRGHRDPGRRPGDRGATRGARDHRLPRRCAGRCSARRSRQRRTVWIGYVDNHGTLHRADRRPGRRRRRPAHGLRPPQRRHPRPSPCTGSPASARSTAAGGDPTLRSVEWRRGLRPVRRGAAGAGQRRPARRPARCGTLPRRPGVAGRPVHRPGRDRAAALPARAPAGLRGLRGGRHRRRSSAGSTSCSSGTRSPR